MGSSCDQFNVNYYSNLYPDRPVFSLRTIDRQILSDLNFIPGTTEAEAFIHYLPQAFQLPVAPKAPQ